MTPEEHQLLIETRQLVEEQAKILKSIQRSNRISIAMRAVYWFIIIGLSFGALYFTQPYVDTLKGSLGDIGNLGGF